MSVGLPPKTHFAAWLAVPMVAFFAGAAFVNLLRVDQWLQLALFMIVPAGALLGTRTLFRFIPARCPNCGAHAYAEPGPKVSYLCLACGQAHETGFSVGRIGR